jgi:DNA-directed RNA polymerase specialized sigma24 family protein
LCLHRQNTQQEISDIMGIPLGTVKTHINRGRVVLQDGLQAWRG